jgi:hypothetical protein
LKTKRKAFDVVMAIRRLEEERKIVIAEMAKHWKSLSTRADTLKEMSCRFSSEPLQSTYLSNMLEYYTVHCYAYFFPEISNVAVIFFVLLP